MLQQSQPVSSESRTHSNWLGRGIVSPSPCPARGRTQSWDTVFSLLSHWVFAGNHGVSPSPGRTDTVPPSSPPTRWAPQPPADPLPAALRLLLLPRWFLLQGITPALGQGFASASAELHVAAACPAPPKSSPARWRADHHPHPTHFTPQQLNFFAWSTCG